MYFLTVIQCIPNSDNTKLFQSISEESFGTNNSDGNGDSVLPKIWVTPNCYNVSTAWTCYSVLRSDGPELQKYIYK